MSDSYMTLKTNVINHEGDIYRNRRFVSCVVEHYRKIVSCMNKKVRLLFVFHSHELAVLNNTEKATKKALFVTFCEKRLSLFVKKKIM